jgi:hypothetical protein
MGSLESTGCVGSGEQLIRMRILGCIVVLFVLARISGGHCAIHELQLSYLWWDCTVCRGMVLCERQEDLCRTDCRSRFVGSPGGLKNAKVRHP